MHERERWQVIKALLRERPLVHITDAKAPGDVLSLATRSFDVNHTLC